MKNKWFSANYCGNDDLLEAVLINAFSSKIYIFQVIFTYIWMSPLRFYTT